MMAGSKHASAITTSLPSHHWAHPTIALSVAPRVVNKVSAVQCEMASEVQKALGDA